MEIMHKAMAVVEWDHVEQEITYVHPKDFRSFDQVVTDFEKVDGKWENHLRGITSIEHDHIKNFLVKEIGTHAKIDFMTPEIEKYAQCFRWENESLCVPMDNHMFTQ